MSEETSAELAGEFRAWVRIWSEALIRHARANARNRAWTPSLSLEYAQAARLHLSALDQGLDIDPPPALPEPRTTMQCQQGLNALVLWAHERAAELSGAARPPAATEGRERPPAADPGRDDQPGPLPAWANEQLKGKMHALVRILWGREGVAVADVWKGLYGNVPYNHDTLRSLVKRTNGKLVGLPAGATDTTCEIRTWGGALHLDAVQ